MFKWNFVPYGAISQNLQRLHFGSFDDEHIMLSQEAHFFLGNVSVLSDIGLMHPSAYVIQWFVFGFTFGIFNFTQICREIAIACVTTAQEGMTLFCNKTRHTLKQPCFLWVELEVSCLKVTTLNHQTPNPRKNTFTRKVG